MYFKKVSRGFKRVSMKFHENFEGVSTCLEVSRVFQESFKVFQEYFKDDSRKF